jgi:hypothetical protein
MGGTTRGMKIQANLIAGIFGGASASPIGQSFDGDYKVSFDLWGNYVGDPTNGLNPGGQGQSMMTTFGILTDGDTGIAPGVTDAVWFAATVDGGSGADFRAYSIEREISYQHPIPMDSPLDSQGNPVDGHATHHADSRNNTAELYMNNFGGVSAPAAQVSLFPQQHGSTPLGSIGMEWHEVEIAKSGNIVTWTMDDALLITLDMTDFTEQPDGENIFFGHSDINAGSSAEPDRFDLQFALFDNVRVETLVPPPADNADFNGNGTVDAADYVVWRKNEGLAGTGAQMTGDANGDMNVDAADYSIWRATFATSVPASGSNIDSVAAVPEPGTAMLVVLGLLTLGTCRRRMS